MTPSHKLADTVDLHVWLRPWSSSSLSSRGRFYCQHIIRAEQTQADMSGLFAFLSAEMAWKKEGLEELKNLERTMYRIRAVLHDAEEHWNIRDESSKLKLKELKEVAYDMEDVVDEYEYEVNRCKVEALEQRYASVNNTNKRKRHEQNEMYLEDIVVVAVPNELAHRVRKITARLNEIIDFSDRFTLSENDGERRISHDITDFRHTSSFVVEKRILGRYQDRDRIIDKLLSDEWKNVESPVSVMAIVGMGGLGKTTVAQLVYNSPRVRQSFDTHAWVCVSEPFGVRSITRNIINSLTSVRCEYTELADLQMKFADEIKDKKVLLVFDDVWNERSELWDSLCTPMSKARICQIVVTTRSEAVAKLVQTMPMYQLKCLTFNDSLSLFEQQAAFSVNTPKKLKDIGNKIVQKCNGLRLAIKIVGSMLRSETDEEIWDNVSKSEFFELEQTRNEVLPVLELCYKHMPIYLKRCFIALSLHPKDMLLDKDDIIRCWKLLDLLNCNESYDEDETGSLYLKKLVNRSILQVDDDGSGYHMHDLVHDLACFLSDGEFYRLEGDTSIEIPKKVRFISVPSDNDRSIEIPSLPHSVRAIIMFHVEIKIPESLFLRCKNLRALGLRHCSFAKALAGSMGSLKLIRHLQLEGKEDEFTSISFLQSYNLQTLKLLLQSADYLLVPRDIGHLINLRALELPISMCGCCGSNIRELKNINKVRDLTISGLGRVSGIEEANEAQIQNKRQLRSLCLDFTSESTKCQDNQQSAPATLSHVELLESLQPHRNLTELTIYTYKSDKYPEWLGNDAFSKLTRINLMFCKSNHLPPLGGLPSLKYLIVQFMLEVKYIDRKFIGHPSKGFPSLTYMEFGNMYSWLKWSGVDDSDFVNLDTLLIYSCYNLMSLPSLPSLVTVNIDDCYGISTIPAWSTLRKLQICSCGSLSKVPTLRSLLALYLSDCSNLTAVDSQPSLTSMELKKIDVYSVCFGSLPLLSSLKLTKDLQQLGKQSSGTIPKYEWYSLFDNLRSLQCLEIRQDSATCLGFTQQSLPSLTRLCLVRCQNLQYCDGLAGLTSLQHLEVRACPKFSTDNLHPLQLQTLIMEPW